MEYQIEEEIYPVIIQRKNNKNTYIRVNDNLEIVVSTSYLMSNHQIKKLLKSNEEAVKKMLNRQKKEKKKKESFYYLGKKYDIIIVPTIDTITLEEEYIYAKNIKQLEKWYQREMQTLFKERLDKIYPLFEETIPYPILKIRNMKTRWGVCNRKTKAITLNAALMKENPAYLDYVIVHELSHFVHFDHSKEFWETVEKYCSNYKKIRKKMKE